jgi:hypothetical protein
VVVALAMIGKMPVKLVMLALADRVSLLYDTLTVMQQQLRLQDRPI